MSNKYRISTNKKELDIPFIHSQLINCYWCLSIPLDIVKKSIEHSFCFGVYSDLEQVGFARVISDFATYAYIGDVFIAPKYRGKGLSKMLMQAILKHSDLQNLRKIALATKDAQTLYRQFGFASPADPNRYMEIRNVNIYREKFNATKGL